MKLLLTSALLLATVLNTTVLSAASAITKMVAVPVTQVTDEGTQIRRGTSDITVKSALGEPDQRLSPEVWVYYNFHSNQNLAKSLGCNTLMVTIENGKVADLKLLSRTGVQVVARNLQKRSAPATTFVAQKK